MNARLHYQYRDRSNGANRNDGYGYTHDTASKAGAARLLAGPVVAGLVVHLRNGTARELRKNNPEERWNTVSA